MKSLFTRFTRDESGATAIEYGLIAALIAVVIVGLLTNLGSHVGARLGEVNTALEKSGN